MDNYYERLNQAFANWNGGGEPSLEQRVENLEAEIIQKQDILTFDTEPVKDSENPVTSGGLFSQFGRYATKTSLNEKVDTSNFIADRDRQETEIGVVAALGAKNLLNNQYLVASSSTGVTITDNGDGTYNLSGTPTGTATYLYTPSGKFSSLYGLKIGNTYTITAGSNNVLIRIDYSTNGASWDNGEDMQPLVNNVSGGATFTVPASAIGLYIRFRSTASQGSLNGIVLKPMIRRTEITDDTFAPYAPTNRELYEMILALQSGS